MRAMPFLGFAAVALGGCSSAGKYQAVSAHAPPAQLLNVPFPAAPVRATLATVIVCGGPGAWKRDAWWDEFVIGLKNPGAEPVTLTAAELEDFSGVARAPAGAPWRLEDDSAVLVKEYKKTGVAFAREAWPAGLATGAGVYASWVGRQIASTVLVDGDWVGLAPAVQGPIALSAVAGLALAPTLVIERVLANREDRADIEAEFRLRRLALPVTLAPGQARAGCFFFPMGPNPRALKLFWRRGAESGAVELPLDFLHGLHVPAASAER